MKTQLAVHISLSFDHSEWQSSDGRMPNDEREDHEAQEGTPNIPVHPTVATVKQTDIIESSSATG